MERKISDEALSEFISECEEIIQRVSSNLALTEKGEHTQETLSAMYRDMHTMKGSSQLFGFVKIGEISHAMETSLDPVRGGQCEITEALVDCLYKCLDLIEKMIAAVQEGKPESGFTNEVETLIPKLIEAAAKGFDAEVEVVKDTPAVQEDLSLKEGDNAAPAEEKPAEVKAEPVQEAPKEEKVEAKVEAPKPEAKPEVKKEETPSPKAEEKPAEVKAEPAPKPEAKKAPAPEKKKPELSGKTAETVDGKTATAPTETTVRVQVELLDKLMNLVGELVLVRNQVLQHSSQSEDLEFLNLSQNLDVVTSDLQGEVMQTRMQPIGNILNKYQRVVRDISKDLHKKISLDLSGTETELDKTLLEAIKDPLTHIVRNSCDHGVETPEERKKAGKPEEGHVAIRAYHEGGQVVVQISDDGKGLDRDRILEKAIQKNLITEDRAKRMIDREVFNLIFMPGFSTAQKVSAVSGRGVGMDVVKTNIEKIGGAVEIQSQLGKGTSICLKIPLTLAIVPAMIIRVGKEKFAIPQVKLVELVRVDNSDDSESHIEFLQGKPVFRLRGDLLPLITLKSLLSTKGVDGEDEISSDNVNIVVLNADGEYFGLVVDEILDTADIVVKPLSQFLKSLSVFSGATIMGDGSVALILDVIGIAQRAKIETSQSEEDSVFDSDADPNRIANESQEFLLFEVNATGKYSLPLCMVSRLEEFSKDSIEFSGKQRVVRYRGSILPIIDLNEVLHFDEPVKEKTDESDMISVVVAQKRGRSFGIQVNKILDVVLIDEQIDDSIKDRTGIMGSVVFGKEVIVVVDVLGILDTEMQRLGNFEKKEKMASVGAKANAPIGKRGRILYAEDAPFFRKQVTNILTKAGYEVTQVENGQAALQRLEESSNDEFQLLLSDIEMPKMDGYTLAESLRKNDRFKSFPLIAITTRYRQEDIDRGTQCGFNLYLEKLNADQLLDGINQLIREEGAKAS